jgi:hypothetical protein
MALSQGLVGAQNNADGSTPITQQYDQQGAGLVTELHSRYYQQTVRGKMFSVNTQGTAVTTTAALATTWTGLGIANAAGSGVNLVLTKFTATQFAVGAAATIGIMGGVGVLAASLTPQSRMIGSGTSAATTTTASAGATISTPVLITTFGSLGSVATTGYGLEPGIYVDLEGSIVVPPGSFIATYTSIVTTSALNFGFTWEEVPVIR